MTRRRFEPWPVALAALLCAMIGTSLGFYETASHHPDALVVEDAYTAGRTYSERLRAERRAAELGWRLDLSLVPRAGGAHLEVRVRDGEGRALRPDHVRVLRERPAEGGLDAEIELEAGPDGYAGDVDLPRSGRWNLRVRAERGDDLVERSFATWAP